MSLDINYTEIIIVAISVVVPLWMQNRHSHNKLQNQIKDAVSRDANERKKLYKKFCKLEKWVRKQIK